MSSLPAWDDYAHNKLRHAIRGSGEATARLQGMKLRAELDPPRAATGGFPYPARKLQRTPRAVDQHVARMKELGFLAMSRREELELLAKLEVEALLLSRLG